MFRRLLRLASLCTFAALVFSLGACSKKDEKPIPPVTQSDADDVMQIVAGMTAINNGGYLSPALALYNTTPWPTTGAHLSRGIRGFGVNPYRDSSFVRGTMNWTMRTVYRDSLDNPFGGFDIYTRSIDFDAGANGTVALGTFLGSTGSVVYGHESNGFVDSFDDDDIDFHGFGTMDSGLVTVTNDGVNNYYYIDTTTVLEYNFQIDKGGSAFPDSGEATIAAFVGDLASPNPNNRVDTMDLLITIKFDGTETPQVTLSDNVPDPTTVYRYQLNLTTGAVTRLTALRRGPSGDIAARRAATARMRVTAP